ncbi:MAG: ADP-forming succinate--CoA ligase subunit beta [Gammaproteobacteria bacterium]|nr:ADP-forming succinate--CoA ligase subunit beta [Gammaproteobacteria bacterium]
MNLHEYQAKALFAQYGIPVPEGLAVHSPQEAVSAAKSIGGEGWVVKAQVHSGGRGKGGGVKLVSSSEEVEQAAKSMLGRQLVTKQNPHGLPINSLLVEAKSQIDQELYLGALLDRARSQITFMASSAGGMNIEQVARETPEKILTTCIDPAAGIQAYQCRKLAFGLGLQGKQIGAFAKIMMALYQLYLDKDVSLIEINPLIVTASGELKALDAKINIDSSSLFRQPQIVEMRDPSQEDEKEYAAQQHDLNYITLDGNIGCMVNGAGLAMATMDLVKLQGGDPANFLDVGGSTTPESVAEAFKLILSDDKVKGILVNIFGGIVRCDLIAEGIINAAKQVGIDRPLVVRLEGTNAEKGMQMLADSDLSLITAADFTEAAQKVVAAANATG